VGGGEFYYSPNGHAAPTVGKPIFCQTAWWGLEVCILFFILGDRMFIMGFNFLGSLGNFLKTHGLIDVLLERQKKKKKLFLLDEEYGSWVL